MASAKVVALAPAEEGCTSPSRAAALAPALLPMDDDEMIVDVHTHVFPEVLGQTGRGAVKGTGYGRVAVGSESIQFMPPLNERTAHTPEMLIAHMDWAGVDKAVLLQGSYYGEWNQYVLEAIGRYPERLVGTAYIDPWAADCDDALAAVCSHPGFRGVKLEMSEPTGFCGIHPEARLDDPEIAWLWDELEGRGKVLVLDLGGVGSASYQTDAARTIAERQPALKMVIAHLGQPTLAVAADRRLRRLWERQIDLGGLPNVWFDTAALPAYLADEGYPYPSAADFVRAAIDRIAPTKVMWGTDMPGLLSHATYPQLLRLAQVHLQFLSAVDRALVLGGNAAHVYSLAGEGSGADAAPDDNARPGSAPSGED